MYIYIHTYIYAYTIQIPHSHIKQQVQRQSHAHAGLAACCSPYREAWCMSTSLRIASLPAMIKGLPTYSELQSRHHIRQVNLHLIHCWSCGNPSSHRYGFQTYRRRKGKNTVGFPQHFTNGRKGLANVVDVNFERCHERDCFDTSFVRILTINLSWHKVSVAAPQGQRNMCACACVWMWGRAAAALAAARPLVRTIDLKYVDREVLENTL